jgi:nucleoside-triphosphatase THEP1
MKIYISGCAKSGKTTLVQNILPHLGEKVCGFYTKEVLENGRRKGFAVITSEGKEKMFASKEIQDVNEPMIKPPVPRVGKYYVNIDILDDMLKDTFAKRHKECVYLIDEIGKMELLSDRFRRIIDGLISKNVNLIATIGKIDKKLKRKISAGEDKKTFHLNPANREDIKKKIEEIVKEW